MRKVDDRNLRSSEIGDHIPNMFIDHRGYGGRGHPPSSGCSLWGAKRRRCGSVLGLLCSPLDSSVRAQDADLVENLVGWAVVPNRHHRGGRSQQVLVGDTNETFTFSSHSAS